MIPKVILSSGKDQSPRRFHPWIFSGAIKKIKGEVAEGMIVEVVSNHDEPLGIGHYSNGSIAVRIFSFEHQVIDQEFWNKRIQKAYNFRKDAGLINNKNTNTFRLIHAEGDGLPGLIIDVYGDTAVIQSHSTGMHLIKNELVEALKNVFGKTLTCIYDKSADTMPTIPGMEITNQILWGKPESEYVLEHGLKFKIDWEQGQKTGFFIDQRENRKLLQKYCEGKKVLNTFCYSGGFSVYALAADAALVHSVDSSKKAIVLTDANVELNFGTQAKHQSFALDTFNFLEHSEEKYDVIILDPPAFAKHHNVKHNAVQGYKRLNAEAIRRINPGGVIFTFSCSQAVDKYLFHNTLMSAAIQAGREVRVLEYMSQPVDHAPSIFHPEGEYLKGIVIKVY
ncbi:MAG TPA: class I SAM-dependent rRNA methyltransferase [Bacteroidia bacterium]|nr:class I SAM-dependent rRNA methyltransferase [Bacteroidia bacterium]